MRELAVYDHLSGKRLVFLQNAFEIGYTLTLNELWEARFSLPYSDPKNKQCSPFHYIDIYDNETRIEKFRIMSNKQTRNESTQKTTYQCEHVLATLLDDFMHGWHEIGNIGVYTRDVIRHVLDHQTVHHWELGDCEFSHQYLYGWEDENLLSALFSIPSCFVEEYRWEFDTTSTPWLLHLRRASPQSKGEIRYRKNMIGIEKEEDPTGIITRLYPYGYGEGENKLNIKQLNGGLEYLDAPTMSKYGMHQGYWKDERYQNEESLYQAATKMLNEVSVPYVSYTVDIAHVGSLKRCTVGDRVRVIDDEDGIDFYTRIVSIEKPDSGNRPDDASFKIANKSKDIATLVADAEDRQRIADVYSQGAVTLFTQQFYDNCSPEKPAEFRFYLPDNIVHINQIMLDGNAAAFRAYSKAIKGGGSQVTSTQGGGGSTQASTSGGASTPTTSTVAEQSPSSSSGGSQSTTTEMTNALTSPPQNNYGDYVDRIDSNSGGMTADTYTTYEAPAASHRHRVLQHYHTYAGLLMHRHGLAAHKHPMVHQHAFSISSHKHTVTIPGHSHSVSILAHSHNVTIPSHTHGITLPDHTHSIEYGIYTGTTANTLTVMVDGNEAGIFDRNIRELNLIAFLAKDSEGKVTRGRHTIQVIPDVLTRVELDLVYQLYANSRGGSQY